MLVPWRKLLGLTMDTYSGKREEIEGEKIECGL